MDSSDVGHIFCQFRKSNFVRHHYCISVVNSFLTLRLRCVISRTVSESCPSSLFLPEALWIFNLLYCICLGAVVGMVVIEKWLVTCHCYLPLLPQAGSRWPLLDVRVIFYCFTIGCHHELGRNRQFPLYEMVLMFLVRLLDFRVVILSNPRFSELT